MDHNDPVGRPRDELHALRYEIGMALTEIKGELQDLNEKYDTMANIVGQQARIIREFEDERQRRKGAQSMARFLWGALTASVAAIAYSLHDILAFFFPPKH